MSIEDFFRFPHIPHIAWLGEGNPRDDKVLSPTEAEVLLAAEVVVEEKLDGANLGISVNPDGGLRLQNRGQYLAVPFSGQFKKLTAWLTPRADDLISMLGGNLIIFGEWCAARHSVGYDRLPDYFMVFDVYDRPAMRFWSTIRRNELAALLNLPVVPELFRGETTLAALQSRVMSESSRFRAGSLEGVVIRQESSEWLKARAKLVRPDFTQSINEHWSRRAIEWNRLAVDWQFDKNKKR
jgi:ATP-dependent RNA circularization protein (DNA/RNA ligase family)